MREINPSVVILALVPNVQCPVLQSKWKPTRAFLARTCQTSFKVHLGQHRVVKLQDYRHIQVSFTAVLAFLKKGSEGIIKTISYLVVRKKGTEFLRYCL